MPIVASWMTFWSPRAGKSALLAGWEVCPLAVLLSAGAGTLFPDELWPRPPLTVLFEPVPACVPQAARRPARPRSANRRGRRFNDTIFTSQARTPILAKSSDGAD